MKNLKSALKRVYTKELFSPGFIGFFINPFFFARRALYHHIKDLSHFMVGRLLDVGCGKKPYRELFQTEEYIGIDIENPGHDHSNEDIDVFYDGKHIPFSDETFDSVLCSQVFEHVFSPNDFLSEIHRVLKDKGHLLLTVPFIWDEHEQPNDYGRYASFGIKHILSTHGFEIVEFRKSTEGIKALAQLLNGYIHKKLYTRSTLLNFFIALIFIFPVNFAGFLKSILLPKNSDLYLDNIVLARKIAHA